MERRVLLAVVLSFIVLYAYQAIFVPPQPPAQSRSSASPTTEAPVAQSPAPTTSPAAAPAPIKPVVGESLERDIVVDTATVRAVFTNRGARIKQWLLKSTATMQPAGQPGAKRSASRPAAPVLAAQLTRAD